MGKWINLTSGERGKYFQVLLSEQDIQVVKTAQKRMNKFLKDQGDSDRWTFKDALMSILDTGLECEKDRQEDEAAYYEAEEV